MEFRILVCAQDVQIFLLLRHVLATEGFMAFCVDSLKEAEDRLCDPDVRAVIADCSTCAVDAASLRTSRSRDLISQSHCSATGPIRSSMKLAPILSSHIHSIQRVSSGSCGA